jgi:glycosyltransferase involved in cell wall biosynthesis
VIVGSLDNKKELPFMYADSDIVLSIPSSDSSPLTVYEAMACHVPVIVSDIDWYKDNFISGKHLLTVPVRDEIALSQRILDILNGNKVLDLDGAGKVVLEHFDYKKENLKLVALMKNLIQKKGKLDVR